MLIRDDKEYRNIQQQVAKNTSDIQDLKEGSGFDIDAYTKEESDAKYQTKTAMSDYYTKTAADSTFQTQAGMSSYATTSSLNSKQDTLVSGTNIKTINGVSVLGSGDIVIGEGGTTVTGGTGIIVSNEGEISIDTSVVAELSDIPTVPTKTSQLTNDSGFITGINSTDVTTALGYTPGTSNFSGDYDDLTDKPTLFSGDYNDLTNKPTIPAAVSGTNDGTNWTSLTIGNDTYGLASGGGSTAGITDITSGATSLATDGVVNITRDNTASSGEIILDNGNYLHIGKARVNLTKTYLRPYPIKCNQTPVTPSSSTPRFYMAVDYYATAVPSTSPSWSQVCNNIPASSAVPARGVLYDGSHYYMIVGVSKLLNTSTEVRVNYIRMDGDTTFSVQTTSISTSASVSTSLLY